MNRRDFAGTWSLCLPLALLAWFGACAKSSTPPDDSKPPLRIDLTETLPRVESSQGTEADESMDVEPVVLATRQEPKESGSPHPVTVRDRALGSGLDNYAQPGRDDLRLAVKARTIEHRPDLRLVWSLEPPPEAVLTFRPAVPSSPGCVAIYRLAIRVAGSEEPLFEEIVSGPPLWESGEESLDLSGWSGKAIELVASGETRPAEGTQSVEDFVCADEILGWVSPVVWSRTRVEDRQTPAPSVLLVGLDTVRADRIGAWGRRPSPTPALDRLAAESDVFLQAYSAFNVTNPSFVSLHTGLFGKNHGVYELDVPVSREAVTLAEVLKDEGYATQAVVAATHLADRASGLGQGFDGVHIPWGQFAAEEVVRRGLRWLAGLEELQVPFFLWLHFFDAHTPHLPPLPYALGKAPAEAPGLSPVSRWLDLRPEGLLRHVDLRLGAHPEAYDDGLAYLDRQIGRLLDGLDRRGLLETTWIVVVADHGENLTEHGLVCRHAGLFDTTLHVPLMIRPPGPRGRTGRTFDALVQTVDVFPTILRSLGVTPPPADGRDLYRIAEAGGRPAVYAEHAHATGAAIRTTEFLYYRQDEPDDVEAGIRFFDLRTDPLQEENLAGRGWPEENEMATRLANWLANRRSGDLSGAKAELSQEEQDQLRALGYVD